IRAFRGTGVQTCALPICATGRRVPARTGRGPPARRIAGRPGDPQPAASRPPRRRARDPRRPAARTAHLRELRPGDPGARPRPASARVPAPEPPLLRPLPPDHPRRDGRGARMRYVVTLAGRTFEVVVDGDSITVDGTPVSAGLVALPGSPLRHLLAEGRGYLLAARRRGSGRWAVE